MSPIKFTFNFFVLLFSIWILGFVAYTATSLVRQPAKPAEVTDAIVVLTGGKNRIETGLQLFSEGKAKELFISGVHANVLKEELLARWQGKPLPECCFTMGQVAKTTTENAAETKEWINSKGFKTIRLVTSNYHMNRALLEFHNAMPDLKILPHPIEQPDITTSDEYFWHVIVVEYHKTIFRFFDMFIKGLR